MQTINNEPEMVVNKNSQWVDSVHGSGSKPRRKTNKIVME